MKINLFTSMKINKVISIILVLEFIYVLYNIYALYKIMSTLLITFSSSYLVSYILAFLIIILLVVSAIGIFFRKKWAVITLWILIILPFIVKIVMPFMAFIGGNHFVVINVIAATYLTITFWERKSEKV